MLKDKLNLQLFAGKKEEEPKVEDYKALYEQMKKEAQEAKELADKLQTEATVRASEGGSASVKTVEEYLEQKVPIMLYKDGEKYKDDVVIGINGEKVQIQRGIQVYVKRKFLGIIEAQYRQQMVAANLQDQLADEFAADSKTRGINL